MFRFKKRTLEDSLNSHRIRDRNDHLLKDYYQACTSQELPPQLRAVLKKLDEEKPELSLISIKSLSPGPLIQIKVILSGRAENSAWAGANSAASAQQSRRLYKNAQLFCACYRYRDDHASNFVGAI